MLLFYLYASVLRLPYRRLIKLPPITQAFLTNRLQRFTLEENPDLTTGLLYVIAGFFAEFFRSETLHLYWGNAGR